VIFKVVGGYRPRLGTTETGLGEIHDGAAKKNEK
jgi:hypothetical protein